MKLTTILIFAMPVISIAAALFVGKRVFKKTGSGSAAVKKHFLTVVLASMMCLMFTVVASAAEGGSADTAAVAETTVSESALAAQAEAVGNASGMGFIGAALAIGLSAIGAGVALAGGAPAAIGAIAENPKSFGKAMIFVVLGEAVALYGLVVAMLIVFLKIPDLSSFVG